MREGRGVRAVEDKCMVCAMWSPQPLCVARAIHVGRWMASVISEPLQLRCRFQRSLRHYHLLTGRAGERERERGEETGSESTRDTNERVKRGDHERREAAQHA